MTTHRSIERHRSDLFPCTDLQRDRAAVKLTRATAQRNGPNLLQQVGPGVYRPPPGASPSCASLRERDCALPCPNLQYAKAGMQPGHRSPSAPELAHQAREGGRYDRPDSHRHPGPARSNVPERSQRPARKILDTDRGSVVIVCVDPGLAAVMRKIALPALDNAREMDHLKEELDRRRVVVAYRGAGSQPRTRRPAGFNRSAIRTCRPTIDLTDKFGFLPALLTLFIPWWEEERTGDGQV